MGKVYIGISGWSYYDWKGIFYPADMKSANWLSYYSDRFALTEINSSFYHLPRAKTVLNWMDKVPAKFKFCPKISKYLTHIARLKDAEEPLQRFFEVFHPLQKQLGPILVQLPPSLKFDPSVAEAFFALLKKDYKAYHFALEARHESWATEPAFALMRKFKVSWVISQSGVAFPYAEQVTAKAAYLRFHGLGKLYASSYSDEMLSDYAQKISRWANDGHDVWVFFNNCYNGVAIDNADTLRRFLGELLPKRAIV